MSRKSGTLADYFVERKQRGLPGLPVYSVTMHDGLVPRDELERRTESTLSDEAHLLVEPGDIAYNMMRMWQGALGLADRNVLVSPAYVVMRPKPTVDPRFAVHWMKSERGLYLLWAYSHGLTEDRLRLYGDDFLSIPARFPELREQTRIAEVLDHWGNVIALAGKMQMLAARRQRATFLRLTSSCQLCELTDVATVTMGQSPPSASYVDVGADGSVPLVQGAADFTEGGLVVPQKATKVPSKVIRTRALLISVRAPVGATALSDDVVCLGRGVAALLPRSYSIELLQTIVDSLASHWHVVSQGGTFEAVSGDEIKATPVPALSPDQIPALDQWAVAARATSLAQARHLHLLRRQKRALAQKLLSGEWRVPRLGDPFVPGGPMMDRIAEAAE